MTRDRAIIAILVQKLGGKVEIGIRDLRDAERLQLAEFYFEATLTTILEVDDGVVEETVRVVEPLALPRPR